MVIFTNVSAPTEGILHKEENTGIRFGERHMGMGTTYVTENTLCWIDSAGKGFAMGYESIGGFAICLKQSERFPDDVLFVMNSKAGDSDDENEEHQMLNEDFQLIPKDIDSLRLMYQMVVDAQKKNSAAVDAVDNSGDDDDGNYEDAEDDGYGLNGEEDSIDEFAAGDNATIHSASNGVNGDGENDYVGEPEEGMDVEQFEDAPPEH